MEAEIKLGVLGVAALAFLIGGVSNFAGAFAALVLLFVVVAVAGIAGWLILRSQLVARKKLGLLLVISAVLTTWFWSGARVPLHMARRTRDGGIHQRATCRYRNRLLLSPGRGEKGSAPAHHSIKVMGEARRREELSGRAYHGLL